MRLAALAERLLFLAHRVGSYTSPWKVALRPAAPAVPLFEQLQQVLRLATHWPAGPEGDDIRRAACELIEAESDAARHTGKRRMLKAIAGAEWRRARGRTRLDDPPSSTLKRLADALDAPAGPQAPAGRRHAP